ncbi:ribosomal protein S5 domain 2-type protein [Cryomyces antarcticus]|uniref:Ribosomal RNA-processing protein 42 n=1 Tax=Cryomyces antarcticus TaxID=329879 RepID=A0ABR0M9C5_9PEZI|nr:Exosome complex component rrp42 [Cryomyces antarcticus]KAK5021084.1 Exosome complex component rrp42 [Cryomyces antarcticus]KAK5167870.1 hypothetical protein LTR04_007123 [Oleoguttula sp. CCFEE 6159]KAK5296653.1 Exosome complex component rrp42 [Cryomyces antarcticus]
MAPSSATHVLLSPAELSYLHSSLALSPPVRPDGRSSTQFRPLVAESDILPGANGSARVCFPDGTEAIVGVKAEVEKSRWRPSEEHGVHLGTGGGDLEMDNDDEGERVSGKAAGKGLGENSWAEMSIEIPGFRDDDALPVFLAAMLTEALLACGDLKDRLYINRGFHWKLYMDILLLSQPLSYPLPLLSLTTHLALLSARLPKLKSELDEDPLFDDDWDASAYLYPRDSAGKRLDRPPVTLLVMAVGDNIIFDPTTEELAVAEAVLAVSVGDSTSSPKAPSAPSNLRLLSIRTIDPPSRLTPPGVANSMNTATGGNAPASSQDAVAQREGMEQQGVWNPPRGGMRRGLIGKMIKTVVEKGGVAEEVLDGLAAVES